MKVCRNWKVFSSSHVSVIRAVISSWRVYVAHHRAGLLSGEGKGNTCMCACHGQQRCQGMRHVWGEATEQKATKDESAFKKGWYFCDKTDQLFIIKNVSPRSLEFFRQDHKAVLISTGVRAWIKCLLTSARVSIFASSSYPLQETWFIWKNLSSGRLQALEEEIRGTVKLLLQALGIP